MGCEIEPRVRLLEEALGHETVEHLGAEDNVQLPEPTRLGNCQAQSRAFPGTRLLRAPLERQTAASFVPSSVGLSYELSVASTDVCQPDPVSRRRLDHAAEALTIRRWYPSP